MKIKVLGYVFNITEYNTVVITIFLCLLNATTKYSSLLALCLAVFENIILLFLFLGIGDKSTINIAKYLLLFTVASMDTPFFVFGEGYAGTFFSFLSLPLIHHYHFLLYLAMLFFRLNKSKFGVESVFRVKIKTNSEIYKCVRNFSIIYISSIVIGVLNIVIGDNNAWQHLGFYIGIYRHQFFLYSCIYLVILNTAIFITSYPDMIEDVKKFLYDIFLGVAISVVLSVFLGYSSDMGHATVLLLTQVSFFAIIVLLYPSYNIGSNICMITGFIVIFSMLKKTSAFAGKWWVLLFFILMIWIYQFFTFNKNNKKQLVTKIVSIIFIIVAIYAVSLGIINLEGRGLSMYKFRQALSLLSLFDNNWYALLEDSPKFRIDEFINVGIEFLHKPYYLLFGKGLSGTIQHHTIILDWNIIGSTFSKEEISYGVYAYLHNAINIIFLSSGAIGIYSIISEAIYFLRKFRTNILAIIGFIWLIIFWGTAYLSMLIGAICLVIAKIDK